MFVNFRASLYRLSESYDVPEGRQIYRGELVELLSSSPRGRAKTRLWVALI